MGKIDIIEGKIIVEELTDDMFQEYITQLKKVPKYKRLEHCYNTAIQIPVNRYNDSIRLIEFGIENYDATWFSLYTSYLFMGNIFERKYNYQKAFEAYNMARSVLGEEHSAYIPSISLDILWTKLHIDNFQYSERIKELYNISNGISDFEKGFTEIRYKLLIAKIVILMNTEWSTELIIEIKNALKLISNNNSYFNSILIKHKIDDKLNPTPESIHFLTKLNQELIYSDLS